MTMGHNATFPTPAGWVENLVHAYPDMTQDEIAAIRCAHEYGVIPVLPLLIPVRHA